MPDRTKFGLEQGASMPPRKPKIRKKLQSMLLKMMKTKKPKSMLGIASRVRTKK